MAFYKNIYGEIYDFARFRNGEKIHTEINGVPVLILQRIEDADHVLRTNSSNYKKNMAWFRQAFGFSRFSEDGDAWRIRHKLTHSHLTQFDRQRVFEAAEEYAEIAFDELIERGEHGTKVIDDSVLHTLTISVLMKVFFEISLDDTKIDINVLSRFIDIGSQYTFVPPGKIGELYRESVAEISDLRGEVLAGFREFRTGRLPISPMLRDLLDADADPNSTVVLEHELVSFLSAGAETTAAGISWALYLLGLYPDIQEEIRQEVMKFWNSETPDHFRLSKLAKLGGFLSETLRLYPPTPVISRIAIKDDAISGTPVKSGDIVVVSIIGIQHDLRLRPDPWRLDISEASTSQRASGTAMAFSFGPRVCGGKHFALMEMMTILAVLLRKGRVELTSYEQPQFRWKSLILRDGGQPVRIAPLKHDDDKKFHDEILAEG